MRFSRVRVSLIFLILGAAPASQGTTFTVQVAPGGSLVFSPASQTISVGDTVHWVWAGSVHSTTSGNACTADGLWDSGVQNTGFTFDVTFPTAGTFNYFCSVHCDLGMTGTIIVNPPSTPTPTATPTFTKTPTLTPTPTPTVAGTATNTPTPTATRTPAPPSSFFSLAPCRVADTRGPSGPYGGPALVANADRTFVVAGQCGVPSGAAAAAFNFTVTQPTGLGDLRTVPGGGTLPLVSTMNWRPGQTRANNAIVSLGAAGDIVVHVDQANGSVHLIIDVNGYFQ